MAPRRVAALVSLFCTGLISFGATTAVVDARVRAAAGPLAGASVAGTAADFTPAGNYRTTSVNASMCCGGLTVSVNDSTSTSRPLGGPSTSTSALQVSFNVCDFTNNVCGSGCFLAGPSDFTFSSDFSSATLSTKFDGTQAQCPQPFGGPPPSFSMPSPAPTSFTLNASWTNSGSVGSDTNIARYLCAGYTSETLSSGAGANAMSATTSISLDPAPSDFGPGSASLNTFDQTIHAQGTPAGSCNPVGGKGAGPGPLGIGNFRSSIQQAGVTLPPSTSFPLPLIVSVTSSTNVSSPRGGSTSTQAETDLNISTPFFPPEQGCFVLPAGAFAAGSSGATLHASIDIDGLTQQCQFSPPATGLPDEFRVDITWSANGALATFRSNATFSCRTLSNVSSSVQTSVNAGSTGQLSGLTDPFNAVAGDLFTNASTVHTVTAPTC